MSQTIIIILISYFLGFLFVLAIRSHDKYDKEPLGRLVLFTFVGGLVSVGVASFIYLFVHPKTTFFDAIFKIGTVEELAKLITLVILYSIIKKEYNEIVDGIVYMAAIALGFSVIENIFYTSSVAHPFTLLAQRTLFATLGHMAFSVYMGIAFYVHKKVKQNYLGIFVSYIIAVLAHGLYDGFIFDNDLVLFFIPTYIFIIYLEFRLLRVALAYSKFKKPFAQEYFNLLKKNTSNYCCNCSNLTADLYEFQPEIQVSVCCECGHVILKRDSFLNLLKFYRPKLKHSKYVNDLQLNMNRQYIGKDKINIYSAQNHKLNASTSTLYQWLNDENKKDLQKYHRSIEGIVFSIIGFGKISN